MAPTDVSASKAASPLEHLDVVIPTYNRGPALADTLRRVLSSGRPPTVLGVHVVVVDDGSRIPARDFVQGLTVPAGFSLEVVRQANAGPARARNTGFHVGDGQVVLFLDDDVLIPDDLLAAHHAAHEVHPGAVICGRCPWKPPASPGAVFRVLGRLGYDPNAESAEDFVPIPIVASGQVSVERRLFSRSEPVYLDSLETPAAEEYELSWRLKQQGIPLLLASRIVAAHDSPVSIEDVCRQQYKHGLGCAEAAQRCPEARGLSELEAVVSRARFQTRGALASVKGSLRAAAVSSFVRRPVLLLAKGIERAAPQADAFMPIYHLAVSQYFLAGVRDGLRHYPEAAPC